MQRVVRAREDRAGLTGPIADRDDVVEGLSGELIDGLAASRRPVHPGVGEGPDRVWVHALGLGAGREDLEVTPTDPTEHGLGDLAARAVAGAHEEHADGGIGHASFPPLAAGPARRCNGRFEIDELAIEAVEVVALADDGRALLGDERHQVTIDFAVFEAEPRHPAGVLRPEPETPQAHHQPQSCEVFLGVFAVAVGVSGCRRQDADRLIPAHR